MLQEQAISGGIGVAAAADNVDYQPPLRKPVKGGGLTGG